MGSRLIAAATRPSQSAPNGTGGVAAMASGFGDLFDRHPLPHLAYDLHTLQILAANDAAVALYGWSRDELLSRRRDELMQPDEWDAMRRFIAGLPATAESQPQRVWRERHRDGHELRTDVRGVNVWHDGREVRVATIQDAQPRMAALEDAQRQRDLLDVAGRAARLGGWRLDLATRHSVHTAQVRAIHELGPGDGFDLESGLTYYPPGAREQVEAALDDCRRQARAFTLEVPFVTAKGRELTVRVTGEPVLDARGAVVALHGSLQDITERQRAEAALAESRARLDAVVRVLPDLWMVFDAEDRHVDVSDPNHPALAAPWADKLGKRLDEVIDIDLARQMREAADEARDTGHLRSYFYAMAVRSGEHRYFEGRSVPMDGGRWMNLVRDITDIVHLERRFRTLTDALPVGVFETDETGWCTYVNPAWQGLFGLYDDAGLGTGWAGVLHPDDLERIRATWGEAVQRAADFSQEFRLRPADGIERRVAARSNPIRRADGRVMGHVGTVLDVTQARELEDALRARKVAEEVTRRQAAFLSRLSHELRTPLNAIIGFTELMQMQSPTAAAGTALGHVRDAGRHMLALVNDLLELQQLQQGHVSVRPEPVAAGEALAACLALLDPLIRQRAVRATLRADADLAVRTDRRTLQQVLLNLASNAVKYGQPVGGRVELSARAQPGGGVRFEVIDDGPGLTAAEQERLFQPFERLGQERKGQPGSGLGLVITRQLVQLLGGSLALASTPGAGTTVTLDLPAEVGSALASAVPTEP
jgi:PAS domain S-box-containing protein